MTDNGEQSKDTADIDKLECIISIQLTADGQLIFDAGWQNSDALPMLAKLIIAITQTDLIMENIAEMNTDDPSDIVTLMTLVDAINNEPVMKPLDISKKLND